MDRAKEKEIKRLCNRETRLQTKTVSQHTQKLPKDTKMIAKTTTTTKHSYVKQTIKTHHHKNIKTDTLLKGLKQT